MPILADIQHKTSRVTNRVPLPADFTLEGVISDGITLINSRDRKSYMLADDLTTVVCMGDANKLATAVSSALIGAANGLAPLGADLKVPLANMPAVALSGLKFKGVWNATTAAPSATPTEGDYWIVQTAGTTALGTEAEWQPKDWAVYSGAAWRKVDNSEAPIASISGGTF